MEISFLRTEIFQLNDPIITHDTKYVVWWYGPLRRNRQTLSVPRVVVFLRELRPDGTLGGILQRETILSHLGLLRLGSVWRNGQSESVIEFPTVDFDVSFNSDAWRHWSPYEEPHRAPSFRKANYPLPYRSDRNLLLDFDCGNGRQLLIPSLEFFVRTYGASAEIKRVLATYPYSDATRRLAHAEPDETDRDTWAITIDSRLRYSDGEFLAHLVYDEHTQRVAKNIYSDIESSFGALNSQVFPAIEPWFLGDAKIRVAGIPMDGGKTFLALRILGLSGPETPRIICYRNNFGRSNSSDASADEECEESPYHDKVLNKGPETAHLTDQLEPDRGSASLDIQEPSFVRLGKPREVAYRKHSDSTKKTRKGPTEGEATLWSAGDYRSSGKGVGRASIHAPPLLDSEGRLRDMWNACRHFCCVQPDKFSSAQWFTFEDGFQCGENPKLITFEPFIGEDCSSPEKLGAGVKNWPYKIVKNKTLRGALVIRLLFKGRPVYLFEIQPRLRAFKNAAKSKNFREELFKGLVFALDDERDLESTLNRIRNHLRLTKGVFRNLDRFGEGVFMTFKHPPESRNTRYLTAPTPCGAAILNAMNKISSHLGP